MKYVFFAVIALIGVIATPAMAQKACTMMWCNEGLRLELNQPLSLKGKYDFVVVADGVATHCKGVLPLPDCDRRGVSCDNDMVMIEESGCALPEAGHSFPVIMLNKIPRNITLEITHESGRKHRSEHKIMPHCSYPNGRDCDHKECCSATEKVNLWW